MKTPSLLALAVSVSAFALSPAQASNVIAGEDFEGTVAFSSVFSDAYGTGATSPSDPGDSPDLFGVLNDDGSDAENSIDQDGASNATNYFFVEDADGRLDVFFDSLQNIDTARFRQLTLDFDLATGGDFENDDAFGLIINGNLVSTTPGNSLQFQSDGTFREGRPGFPDGITGGFVSVSDLLGSAIDLSVFDGQAISIGFAFQTNSNGEDIAIDNIRLTGTAVPIPGAALLFGGALAAGTARRFVGKA
ncbi:MAG: hypothetical protein AAGH41_08070 [Pseudomonadota bacterium]